MKSTILLGILCIASHVVFAQLSKGTLFVGPTIGTGNYNSVNNNFEYADSGLRKTTNHNFGISAGPQIGVFLTDHIVVGGNLGVDYTHNKTNVSSTEGNLNNNNTERSTLTINVGPFARYYFFNTTPGSTVMFAQMNARVGTGNGSSSGNGDNNVNTFSSAGKISNVFNWNAGGSLGVTHFIQKKVGLDLFAGYTYGTDKSHNINTTTFTPKAGGPNSVNTSEYDLTTHNNNFVVGAGFHWFFSHKS